MFSLVGKIKNTGLVEMPLGTPLSKFVYEAGGGGAAPAATSRPCRPADRQAAAYRSDMLETPVDFESLGRVGSIMGSGGMVVMDEDNCMVDAARYFVEFMRSESCGKCTPCRVGLDKALRTLTRITKGEGREEDLAELDELGRMIRDTSLCGLGQSAPNSMLTALRHFREEFEDHIRVKRCRAGVCQDLAVAPCENSCPIHMNIPRFLAALQGEPHRGRIPVGDHGQSAAGVDGPGLSASLRKPLPASNRRRAGQHARSASLYRR